MSTPCYSPAHSHLYEAYQKYIDLGLKDDDIKLEAHLSELSHKDFQDLGESMRLFDKEEFSHRYVLFELQESIKHIPTCYGYFHSYKYGVCRYCKEAREFKESREKWLEYFKRQYSRKELISDTFVCKI